MIRKVLCLSLLSSVLTLTKCERLKHQEDGQQASSEVGVYRYDFIKCDLVGELHDCLMFDRKTGILYSAVWKTGTVTWVKQVYLEIPGRSDIITPETKPRN